MRKLVEFWDARPGLPFVMVPGVVGKGMPKGEDLWILWIGSRYHPFEDRCLPATLLPDDQKLLHRHQVKESLMVLECCRKELIIVGIDCPKILRFCQGPQAVSTSFSSSRQL